MAGLVPAIHALFAECRKDVDAESRYDAARRPRDALTLTPNPGESQETTRPSSAFPTGPRRVTTGRNGEVGRR
jgi:hypothetical protein